METIEQEVAEITEPVAANTIPAEVPIEDTEEFIQLVKNSVDEQYVIEWLFERGFDWVDAYTVLKKCVVNHGIFIQTYVDHLDEMIRCIKEAGNDEGKMMEIYQSSGYENIIIRYIKDYKKVGDATAYTLYRNFVWRNSLYNKKNFNQLRDAANKYTRKAKEIYPEIDEDGSLSISILNNAEFPDLTNYISKHILNKITYLNADGSDVDAMTYLSRYIKKYKLEYNQSWTVNYMSSDKSEENNNMVSKKLETVGNVVKGIALVPMTIVAVVTYALAGLFACIAIYILISGFSAFIS